MAVSSKIKIPNLAFGTFIRAANDWLSRTIDAKTSLEVSLANKDGKLHLSVGADASYIEAYLTVDPKDIEALHTQMFLDVKTLASYAFDQDGLTMTVPATEKEDQRITFSVPGFNFRVPRKKGDIWRRNAFDLSQEEVTGLLLNKKAFTDFWKNLELPNSFKVEHRDFQFCLEVEPTVGFSVHAYDGFGALYHTFRDPELRGKPGRMIFLEDFFKPCTHFSVEESINFGVNDRQCLGEFKAPTLGIEVLRWTQPRFQKVVSEIPAGIENSRKGEVTEMTLDPEELKANLKKACMFLAGTEMRSTPVEFYVVEDQYALVTKKSSGEGEVRAEGLLKNKADKNLELNIQPQCWKDYLDQFDKTIEIKMEFHSSSKTALLSQKTDTKELIYWMPLMPRTGD